MEPIVVVFGHRGVRYALDARAVREIVWLPALSPVFELPPFIIGVLDLRGRVLPVMDLGLRFGLGADRLRVDDRVVVLEEDGACVGLLVSEVFAVTTVLGDAVAEAGEYSLPDPGALDPRGGGAARFIAGQLKLEDGLVMRLDVGALLREAPAPEQLEARPPETAQAQRSSGAADAELFRRRREELARPVLAESAEARLACSVVRIGDELFAFEAAQVVEFAHLRGLTPIPCTPPHVAGNMNLRGELLTVIELGPALGLSGAQRPALGRELAVLTTTHGDRALRFGVVIDEALELVSLTPAELAEMPVASRRARVDEGPDCCSAAFTLAGRTVSLVDMRRVLASPAMQLGL